MADKADKLSGYAEGSLSSWLSRNGVPKKEIPEYRSAFAQSYVALRGMGEREDSAVSSALMALDAKRGRQQQVQKAAQYPIKLTLAPMNIDTV